MRVIEKKWDFIFRKMIYYVEKLEYLDKVI